MNVTSTESTLQLAKRLMATEFTQKQSEELAEILREQRSESMPVAELNNLATKSDIELLGKDLTIKFGSFMIIAVGVILTAMRYLS